jgi:hypothetical protein
MATPGSLATTGIYGSGYTSQSSLLQRPFLTKMVELTRNGLPDPLPATWYADKQAVPKNYAQAFTDIGMRNLAPVLAYDGKAITIQEKALGETFFTLLHSHFELPLRVSDFMSLIKFESLDEQNMGYQEIGRQIKSGVTRMHNLRSQLNAAMIFQGNVWIDKEGGLLPSSTNAVWTTNYGVPTGNTGQLNVFGTGNFLTVGWENTGSAVPDLDILNLRQAAIRLTGYPIKHALYGINVPGYLTQNTRLNNYFYRDVFRSDGAGQTFIDTGELAMRGLLGLNWIPAWASFWIKGLEYPMSTPSPYSTAYNPTGPSLYPNNTAGTPAVASMVGSSAVTFVPDPAECAWLRHFEGKYPVPNTPFGIISPDGNFESMAAGALSKYFDIVTGMGVYAQVLANQSSLVIGFVDTYGPWAQIPQAIFQGTTSF